MNQTINGNSLVELPKLPANYVDLVVTDPPFAIGLKAKKANYNRDSSLVLDGYHEIKPEDYLNFTRSWMKQSFRILKDTGSMFVFSGYNNLKDILITLDDIGFHTVNHIIWKYQFGVRTSNKFVASHYHLLYVCKNESKRKFYPWSRFKIEDKDEHGGSLHYQDKEDVWIIKKEYWTGKIKTPTKLPTEIIMKILEYTSIPGDLVLDPFLGSGQVALVSKQMKRNYIGIEIVKEYYDFAVKRIEENNK